MEAKPQEQAVNIRLMVRELHAARTNIESLKQTQAAEREAFREDHKEVFEGLRELEAVHETEMAGFKATLEVLDQTIRDAVVMHFVADPAQDKSPFPGVGIRETVNYDYDPGKALDWALEHKMCLALDTKAFKGLCKTDSTRPEFVTLLVIPTATIAEDLSKAVL